MPSISGKAIREMPDIRTKKEILSKSTLFEKAPRLLDINNKDISDKQRKDFTDLVNYLTVALRSRYSGLEGDKNIRYFEEGSFSRSKYSITKEGITNFLHSISNEFNEQDAESLIIACTHRNTTISSVCGYTKSIKNLFGKFKNNNIIKPDISRLKKIKEKLEDSMFDNFDNIKKVKDECSNPNIKFEFKNVQKEVIDRNIDKVLPQADVIESDKKSVILTIKNLEDTIVKLSYISCTINEITHNSSSEGSSNLISLLRAIAKNTSLNKITTINFNSCDESKGMNIILFKEISDMVLARCDLEFSIYFDFYRGHSNEIAFSIRISATPKKEASEFVVHFLTEYNDQELVTYFTDKYLSQANFEQTKSNINKIKCITIEI